MDIEKLKEMVELPGQWTFKIIVYQGKLDRHGLLDLTKQTLAREEVQAHLEFTDSRTGKYRSFTLNIHLETFEELESLYQTYKNHEATAYLL